MKSGERIRLPLSGWYPFKIDKPAVFELIYAYQIFATCINGLRNISMDTFLSGSIMVISGQLAILNNSLQIMEQCSKSKVTSEVQGNQEKFRKILVRNVIHYKNIIQFADKITSLFSICLIGQFVVSVIILCLVSPMSLQFLSMTVYQACILLEIFLWSYYGNEVIIKV
ncbi:odorant receptor 4-like [Tenebrio molitor]|uniref:odorant receptor 4-like n=1 Tax=Tenebrio molitor TaxID=7067 RepID=UPI00362481E8